MEPAAHQSIMAFTRDLSARSPAPGGGAAGGVSASIAASLAGMVVSYSIGRKSTAAHDPRLKEIQTELKTLRRRALELADEDAAAYTRLNRLQRLPEDDSSRQRQLPSAAMTALRVPAELAELASRVSMLLDEIEPISNPYLRADLVSAAAISSAAATTAEQMVLVNARGVPDEAGRKATDQARKQRLACEATLGRLCENRAGG